MLGTIKLYNLRLSPLDTLYFKNITEQQAFFEEQEHITLENVTYNMSRELRINGNAFLNITSYSYAQYTFNGKILYFFINSINWINDNVISLDVSIDHYQSFCIDNFTYRVFEIGNRTLGDNIFNKKYLPYTNLYPVSNYFLKRKYDFDNEPSTNYKVGFIVVNVDESIKNTDAFRNINISHYIEMGYAYSFLVLVFPVLYDYQTKSLWEYSKSIRSIASTTSGSYNNFSVPSLNAYEKFIETYGGYIKNVGLTFQQITTKYWFYSNAVVDGVSNTDVVYGHKDGNNNYIIIANKSDIINHIHNLDLPENTALWRDPYVKLTLGSFNKNVSINLLDYIKDKTTLETTKQLTSKHFQSLAYPYQTHFEFEFNGNKISDENIVFNLDLTTLLPYDVSKWSEYYSRYTATINDGLATKHYYERFNLGVNTATSVTGGLLNMIGGIATKNVGAGVGGLNQIVESGANVITTLSNQAKEKELLELNWRDVQSQPDQSVNVSSLISIYLCTKPPIVELYLYVAKNIDDINRKHSVFGYTINRSRFTDGEKDFSRFETRTREYFDYMSCNVVSILTPLPQAIKLGIMDLFTKGFRLWWNYGVNFGNLNVNNGVYNE